MLKKKVKKKLKSVEQETEEDLEDEEEELEEESEEEEDELPEVERIKKEVSAPAQIHKKIIDKPSRQEMLDMVEGHLLRSTDLIRLAREM